MPPTLQHLDAPERAALLVRLIAAAVFRDGGLPGADERSRAVQGRRVAGFLRQRADVLGTLGEAELDQGLQAVLDGLGEITIDGPGATMDLVRARLASATDRIRAVIADAAHRRHVPLVLEQLFGSLSDHVWERYEAACPWYGPRPVTLLEMGGPHEHNTADLLDETDLVPSCRPYDREGPTSIVRLGVRKGGFSWRSSCQLAYVMTHELACHAFQGLGHPPCEAEGTARQPRSTTDSSCAWSEGWMDVVALRIAERWARQAAAGSLAWAGVDAVSAHREACALHLRRSAAQSRMTPHKLARRQAARDAAEAMREECSKFGGGGDDLMERFSLCLNALPVQQADRDALVDAIGLGLELAVDDARDDLMSALLALHGDGDWRTLARVLRRILDVP